MLMILLVLPDVSTDDDLMRRLRRADETAIVAVYERYFSPLYQYARLKVGDSVLAEDLISNVFYELLRVTGTDSAPHTNLRGWLFRVARNEIAQHFGKVRHLPLADLEEWMPAPAETNPETQVTLFADTERVRHALRMLTAAHQEVLLLRFGQRLSLKETADIMGKSVSAIKSLQFRALDTLRQILYESDMEAANG